MSVSGTQPDSPVGGDGVETGAGSAAPGLTGALPGASDSGSGRNGSGDLRASLVAVILGLSGDLWHLPTRTDATVMADAILADGWVRVSVDDETVERVAIAMAEADGYSWECSDDYRRRARAAVQALRDGSDQ